MFTPLPQSEDCLSLLCSTLDLLPDPGFVVDLSGRIIGWNRRLEQLSGVSRDEMVGKDGTACGLTFYGEERPPLVDRVLPFRAPPDLGGNALQENGPDVVSVEVHLPCIGGVGGCQVIAKAAAVKDSSGTAIGGIETLVDISTQRRAIEGLLTANAGLHQVNRVVRHDIMNELTIVFGYLDLAGESITDPDIRDDLARVDQGAHQIQQRIEFTRQIQSYGAALPCWQQLDEVVAAAVKHSSSAVPSVTVREGSVHILADPLLVRVITTFLTNTCHRGGDRVELWTKDLGGCLCIAYSDNGDGIQEPEKGRLFDGNYDAVWGYDLFLDREILAVTGITLRETGSPDEGAQFEMIVPAGVYRIGIESDEPISKPNC